MWTSFSGTKLLWCLLSGRATWGRCQMCVRIFCLFHGSKNQGRKVMSFQCLFELNFENEGAIFNAETAVVY